MKPFLSCSNPTKPKYNNLSKNCCITDSGATSYMVVESAAAAVLGEDNTYRFLMTDFTGDEQILLAAATGNLHRPHMEERVLLGDAKPTENLELWHRRLGHRKQEISRGRYRERAATGIPKKRQYATSRVASVRPVPGQSRRDIVSPE